MAGSLPNLVQDYLQLNKVSNQFEVLKNTLLTEKLTPAPTRTMSVEYTAIAWTGIGSTATSSQFDLIAERV